MTADEIIARYEAVRSSGIPQKGVPAVEAYVAIQSLKNAVGCLRRAKQELEFVNASLERLPGHRGNMQEAAALAADVAKYEQWRASAITQAGAAISAWEAAHAGR